MASSDLKCGTGHREYPGKGVMEGDCTSNPESGLNSTK